MKKFVRFYDEDIRKMIIEKLDIKPSKVTSVYTEEVTGCGMNEHVEPVYYVEVEMSEE